jgi:hypothetical protein
MDSIITPLEGEPPIPGVGPPRQAGIGNSKRFVAVAILALSFVAVIAIAATNYFRKASIPPDKAATSPDVASAQAPSLKMPALEATRASVPTASSPSQAGTVVPSIAPMAGDEQAIAVRGSGGSSGQANGAPAVKIMSPDDAPIFSSGAVPDMHAPATVAARNSGSRVADATASLDAYQRQLTGVLENLQRLTAGGAAGAPGSMGSLASLGGATSPASPGAQGGQVLHSSARWIEAQRPPCKPVFWATAA